MERKQGTHTVYPTIRNFLFFCFVFFIFIGRVRTEDTNNENLSGCKFLGHQTSCNSSSTDGKYSKIWRRQPQNALLETQETITDSVILPVEYNPQGDSVIKLGLGTPPQTRTFLILTGLDVSWTFCEPCPFCNKQDNQLFDSSKSSTYRKVSCKSPSCTTGCLDESSCQYHYKDGDLTNITGGLNTDVLSLNKNKAITGFAFGCSASDNSPNAATQGLDGYFGFGTGRQSLLSMTANKYNNTFSYCLPLDRNTPGFLSLGGNTVFSKSLQFVPFSKSAPLKTSVGPTNYVLDLVGISVDGKSLPIGSSASKSNPLPIVLESGTGLTRFPEEIYTVLRDSFRKLMSKYPMSSETPISVVDTCYDLSGYKNVSVPAIDLTFSNGVVIPLASWVVLYEVSSQVSCFAFSVNGGKYALLGNIQQKAFKIIFDNPNKRIGFDKDACSAERPLNPVVVSAAAPWPIPSVATIAAMCVAVWLNGNMV